MRKVNWNGNDGRCFPEPGAVETAQCGVCGAQMNVERNVLGATSWAEAIAGRKHMHDSFACPHVNEWWHKEIVRLRVGVYSAELRNAADKNRIKKSAEKKIKQLLKAHAVR